MNGDNSIRPSTVMNAPQAIPCGLPEDSSPVLVLAPMQDVTDLPFLQVLHPFGGADYYVTEYFRVHVHSTVDRFIIRAITQNPTDRPVVAQLIGADIEHLVRMARALQDYPIGGIDLNLGCPAPIVCKKDAGGGLLRHPDRIDAILGALRDCVPGCFTVKTRVGYESPNELDDILGLFQKHAIDGLCIHGRTVLGRYNTPIYYEPIRNAVESLSCPVIANGNVVSPESARTLLDRTGARGLMIGRAAIRDPRIFTRVRAGLSGRDSNPTMRRDILDYILSLYETTIRPRYDEEKHVRKMKKYLNFIADGVDEGRFLHAIRRVQTRSELESVCRSHLDRDGVFPSDPSKDSRLFRGLDSTSSLD